MCLAEVGYFINLQELADRGKDRVIYPFAGQIRCINIKGHENGLIIFCVPIVDSRDFIRVRGSGDGAFLQGLFEPALKNKQPGEAAPRLEIIGQVFLSVLFLKGGKIFAFLNNFQGKSEAFFRFSFSFFFILGSFISFTE